MTASSKQSSEHPVRRDLGGGDAGPVAPKSNWRCAEVEMDPTCRVTNDRRRNTLGTREQTSRTKAVLFLRKEVIQPHLPVRLPCYDFTPIANPTFDSSLPKGLGHWLRVLPTFVV